MEENYAYIFLHFLEKMAQEKKFDANDVAFMGTEYSTVVESIDTRGKLLEFLNGYLEDYPEFSELQEHLEDKNYIFTK